MSRALDRIALKVVVPGFVLGVVAFVWQDVRQDRKVAEARAFIDALVPRLHEMHEISGSFPSSIDTTWYDEPIPSLLHIDDFYFVDDDGQRFVLRFRDPRGWFFDVNAFDSLFGKWITYDGY